MSLSNLSMEPEARLDGAVGDRFRLVDRQYRDFVIGALLTHLEFAVGTDKAIDYIDESEAAASKDRV